MRILSLKLESDRILLELNSNDDPVWTYFDGQHKFILNRMKTAYHAGVSSIKCISKPFLVVVLALTPVFN